jgi:hypothetical protein
LESGREADHADNVTESTDEPSRFRRLPEPPRPEDLVETVDVGEHHEIETEAEERSRFLRTAGGG